MNSTIYKTKLTKKAMINQYAKATKSKYLSLIANSIYESPLILNYKIIDNKVDTIGNYTKMIYIKDQ